MLMNQKYIKHVTLASLPTSIQMNGVVPGLICYRFSWHISAERGGAAASVG